MRTTLIALTVIILGFLVALLVLRQHQPISKVITLTNIPATYCPKTATVIVTDVTEQHIISNNKMTIQDCSTLSFSFTDNSEKHVFVRVPNSLAFLVKVTSDLSSYSQALLLGDVNNDNVIDDTDQNFVSSSLFSTNALADVDGDKQVTVTDLALVEVNKGIGLSKPGGGNWQ